jgi:hypothetical protein
MCNAQNFVQQNFSLLPLTQIERLVFLLAFPIRSPRKLGSYLHRHGLGHSADDVAMEIDGPRKFWGQRTQKIASISSANNFPTRHQQLRKRLEKNLRRPSHSSTNVKGVQFTMPNEPQDNFTAPREASPAKRLRKLSPSLFTFRSRLTAVHHQ